MSTPSFRGLVTIDAIVESFPVVISFLGEEALIGRAVTDRFRLTLDHGQRVIVEP